MAAAGERGITREKILRILWAESDEEQARHTLSETLYLLRRETGAHLRLDPSLSSDMALFRDALNGDQLERAAAVYTGPFPLETAGGLIMAHQLTIAVLFTIGLAGNTSAAITARQAPNVWENYDFVPGSRVLFFTDFSEDRVGNFARRLKYSSGPVEVVERGGVKVLRATGRSEILIPVGRRLPDRFTLEIDVVAPASAINGSNEIVAFEGGPELDRGDQSANVAWSPAGAFILGSGKDMGNSPVTIPEAMQPQLIDRVAHLRILMDGAYFKMYVNERRIYNIPELAFKRDSVVRVLLDGGEADGAVYLTSIRLAESETDVLYDALAATGRWATQGVLFETGKAALKPESTPVLKEIAATLKQHADLRILVEGHTDNVGTPAANLALSEARAAAVKTALVSEYGADAARITTKGFGDTKPAVPNTTAEGRAQNRRVEIVKQ